jgi:uncharacterized protein YggU (UPF0235/DUF167 family)
MNKRTPVPGGFVIAVRVRPGASRTAVGGRYDGSLGAALVVAVAVPPVGGRATEAVLVAVAEAFGLKRREVAAVTATTSRDKRLRLSGPGDALAARFAQLLGE